MKIFVNLLIFHERHAGADPGPGQAKLQVIVGVIVEVGVKLSLAILVIHPKFHPHLKKIANV